MDWTRQRLEDEVCRRLGDAKLVVVSNREPFMHVQEDDEIHCKRPAGGLTAALDPVMRACGGVWVAHGSGSADRAVVDRRGRVAVPPDEPAYMLRRVWLNKKEEQGYYYGFSNEALWPLCHVAYARPQFQPTDWKQYAAVNGKFAEAVLDEVRGGPAVVFIQDYHLALLPRMLKDARPDLVVAQFWHIPWPNHEIFRICPWQEEILDGLLGNDLLAFHVQNHCNNFLETVRRALEARVDFDDFSVARGGHLTRVQPHPISIDPEMVQEQLPFDIDEAEQEIRRRLGLRDELILVGVDRVDYTKGIPERFAAIDRLIQRHPELKGEFAFVQIGAPSRTHIPSYRRLNEELVAAADEINWRHGQGIWRPIHFLNEQYGPEQVYSLYRIASGCVVSSLHDGMNLVAKEFVASRDDELGVLVLSRFAGAAAELADDALLVNPYDVDGMARAYYEALTMPPEQQRRRMTRMRRQVEDNNVYRWAGRLLAEAGRLVDFEQPVGEFA